VLEAQSRECLEDIGGCLRCVRKLSQISQGGPVVALVPGCAKNGRGV